MSVGILLITHDDVGSSLLESLKKNFGDLPMPVQVLPIRHEHDPQAFAYHAEQICLALNQGQGVLILTDLFGATPCNIAQTLMENHRVRLIAGVNLPMLVKLLNYPSTDLDTLANKAISGGFQGIFDVNSLLSSG